MKRFLLIALLLSALTAFAKDKNPADYGVTVHVTGSHSERQVVGSVPIQNTYTHQVYGQVATRREVMNIAASVDGKPYEMQSVRRAKGVIDPGDYRAKFTEHGRSRYYELLLPNDKTIKFEVVGTRE